MRDRPFKSPRTHVTKADTIISCEPSRLRDLPDEGSLLSGRTGFERSCAASTKQPPDVARDIAKTDAYRQSRKDRRRFEIFAHLKRILKLDRLRLRGPNGAHDEFLLAATAQNLRRMAKWLCPVEPETTNMTI